MSAPTQVSILSQIESHKDDIHALGVKRIGLFGSFARGEPRAESDVDLLVEFHPDRKTFDNFMRLSFFLEELLDRRIERLTPESISPSLRPRIMDEVETVAVST